MSVYSGCTLQARLHIICIFILFYLEKIGIMSQLDNFCTGLEIVQGRMQILTQRSKLNHFLRNLSLAAGKLLYQDGKESHNFQEELSQEFVQDKV